MKHFITLLLVAASMTMNAKTLVAYFSATGVTKAAAEQIFYTSGSSTIDGALNDLRATYPQYNWEVR